MKPAKRQSPTSKETVTAPPGVRKVTHRLLSPTAVGSGPGGSGQLLTDAGIAGGADPGCSANGDPSATRRARDQSPPPSAQIQVLAFESNPKEVRVPIAQALLPEFDHETANTRQCLERIPDDKLTVYLRLNDVPVPALYGPSADEQ